MTQSWGLKKFVDEYSVATVMSIWKRDGVPVSRQAVEGAVKSKRAIQVILLDGFYEIHEAKILSKTPIHKVSI